MTNPSETPAVVTTAAQLRTHVDRWRRNGERVALVPTMGALHAGHLALVERAAELAGRVVVSIFVNPTQFAPLEDFGRYPRNPERDLAILRGQGKTDLVYGPDVSEIYPSGAVAEAAPKGPALGLETDFRPHFFAGVATVVSRLFLQSRSDFAVFGEKDYQQLLVVKELARNLGVGLEVVGVPTVREADGLALSSRNAYLDVQQRKVAGLLNVVLREVGVRVRQGASIPEAETHGAARLIAAGFERVDYVAVRDAETLFPVRDLKRPARVLAAARIGATRLIDNMAI
ncbi:MAG TPA: pantoate--beta-alanine ligase [Micropepsaceae bacterium]|nr:pantoate--beta-alanine ligase [Micropepsaceae bacterium]